MSLLMAGCCMAGIVLYALCANPAFGAPKKERAQVLNGIVAAVQLPGPGNPEAMLRVTDEASNDIEFVLDPRAHAFDAAMRKLVKLEDLESGTRVRVSFETLRTGVLKVSSIRIVGARAKWER